MIQISNLTFGYGKSTLFQDLNLSLQAGHIYGLLGKNGAGKSTLLKNITGLVFPRQGTCLVNGQTAAKRKPSFLQELFFVPEDIFLPAITAKQFAKSTAHFYPNFDHDQYDKMLAEFDVQADKLLTKLSFGQQKKVMIAFGLSSNTALLVMDEPTNGLDIPSKMQFRKIIAAALTETRCIVISTHQVRDLDNLIDTVLILHDRQITIAKSLDEISEKLTFGIIDGDDYLYAEESMHGLYGIAINKENSYNKVDMELLFNAATAGGVKVTEILNKP